MQDDHSIYGARYTRKKRPIREKKRIKKVKFSGKEYSRGGSLCDHTRMAEGSGCRYILVDMDTCCPTPFSDVPMAALLALQAGS